MKTIWTSIITLFGQSSNFPLKKFKSKILLLCKFSKPVLSFNQMPSLQVSSDIVALAILYHHYQEVNSTLKAIQAAIALLDRFSLVVRICKDHLNKDEENPVNDLLKIHRLVQKVIYDRMDNEQVVLGSKYCYDIKRCNRCYF